MRDVDLGERARHLVELVRMRAQHQPSRLAYTYLRDGEVEDGALTYQDLDLQARAIAAYLQANAHSGDRILLLYPPGLEFVSAFLGCLYAGMVAVPAYPPRNVRGLERLHAIIGDARATLALTKDALVSLCAENPVLGSFGLHSTDRLTTDGASHWQEPDLDGDTMAFLQYTSGSTDTPKGVVVSHGNVLENERVIRAAFAYDERTVMVSWLPVYHDMGLIGGVLQPLYTGFPSILMPPMSFLQRPLRWLEAITRFRATTSGAPNFAFDLCVRKIPEESKRLLDLGCLTLLYNGAEPVRAETLQRFTEAFAPCGFRAAAFFPCYGLAESTLFVSGGPAGSGAHEQTVAVDALERGAWKPREAEAPDGRRLVGCGPAGFGHRVVIVDPESLHPCPAGVVGEIWVSGPSVAQGYWEREQQTQEVFQARLASSGEGPYLRTGDLGYVQDGEVFVTGRIKDLIVIRGRNHYPQDIERTAELCHPAVRSGCLAAFTVEGASEEQLVLVVEIERRPATQAPDPSEPASLQDTIVKSIRRSVADTHDLQVHEVVLVKAATIPKTSSGKIQRRAARKAYLARSLQILGS